MTTTAQERLAKMETKMGVANDDIKEIKSDIKEIKLALESNFITRIEFDNFKAAQLIQKILLSIINLIFGTLLGFFIAQLVNK